MPKSREASRCLAERDIEWHGSKACIAGSESVLPESLVVPQEMKNCKVFRLASRPTEIRFTDDNDPSAVQCKVLCKAFLGEIIDYLVNAGSQEIRVQIGRRDKGPEVGENCSISFLHPFWYNKNE